MLPALPSHGWKTPHALALESGDPTLIGAVTPITEEELAAATAFMRELDLSSLLVLPLHAREQTLGAMTLALTSPARRYEEMDLEVAESLAGHAAYAVASARTAHAAERAIRLRQDILSVVSHDLRNPLSVILMNVERLRRLHDLDNHVSLLLAAVSRAANRMRVMIGDLLDTASIEAHGLAISPTPIAVAPLVADAAETARLQAGGKVTMTIEVAPELPRVLGDADRLEQVLLNLIGNAVKFTEAGGAVTVRAQQGEPATVQFSVSDTGTGIAAADLGRLFDRFYRVKATAHRGTGLGLFIVRGIVESHGGTVWVETQLGTGSTFFFTVPAAPSSSPIG